MPEREQAVGSPTSVPTAVEQLSEPGSTTYHELAKRRVLNRLKRAHGQLAAIIAAVENDKPCREVVTQLAAVSSAIDKAGVVIVSSAMRDCLAVAPDRVRDGEPTIDEIEKLLLMLA